MGRHVDDPVTGTTAVVGVVFVLLFVIVILGLQAYFGRVQTEEYAVKVVDETPTEKVLVHAQQLDQLNGYHWVDRDSGTVSIPIERAMQLVVDELGKPGARP